MPQSESGSSGNRQHRARQRRQFVRDRLAKDGQLPFASVRAQFQLESDSVLYQDGVWFQQHGEPIITQDRAFKVSENRLLLIQQRARHHLRAKEMIAACAARLIAPTVAQQDAFNQPPLPAELADKLKAYWTKANRFLILDAGSTTGAVARHTARLKAPDPDKRLSSLRVLTNGMMIVQELQHSPHGIITVGGAYRKPTGAVAGNLAEQSLASWGFHADLAIIGTTNLNEQGDFCCDGEDEAQIKSRLLESARIRCIAADSAKLTTPGRGSAWAFASLSHVMIDLVITDDGSETACTPAMDALIRQADKRGVNVAIATAGDGPAQTVKADSQDHDGA